VAQLWGKKELYHLGKVQSNAGAIAFDKPKKPIYSTKQIEA
jgi:hypothetical protein